MPRNVAVSSSEHSLPSFWSRMAFGIRRTFSSECRGYLGTTVFGAEAFFAAAAFFFIVDPPAVSSRCKARGQNYCADAKRGAANQTPRNSRGDRRKRKSSALSRAAPWSCARGWSGCVCSGIGRRQATPDQHIGAQVGAGRPNQRAALHAHLPKSCLVVPDLVENWTNKHRSEISLDYATVGQRELYAEVAQRLRFPDAH